MRPFLTLLRPPFRVPLQPTCCRQRHLLVGILCALAAPYGQLNGLPTTYVPLLALHTPVSSSLTLPPLSPTTHLLPVVYANLHDRVLHVDHRADDTAIGLGGRWQQAGARVKDQSTGTQQLQA